MTAAQPRALKLAGGRFAARHAELVGPAIDFAALDPSRHAPELVAEARAVWADRVRTEFRSIQIMTRFLQEVVGAGDPLDVYAGAVEFVQDEIRHTALCADLVRALGGQPLLPEPVELRDPEAFLQAPMGERALATAISMLAINETLSVAFVQDLATRCREPVVAAVLQATVADEEGHGDWGWAYVEASLRRFPRATRADWRHLVQTTLAPHRANADRVLAAVPADRRRLEAWPEPERADLGLHSPQRLTLVYEQTFRERVAPRLLALQLL